MTNLLQHLLEEQQNLSAVERFSKAHDQKLTHDQKTYSELIPTSLPKVGQQFAFEVDLDACTGCKACVVGCHSLNGLDESETWRKTGTLQSSKSEAPYLQTVTTACHHCIEPGCLLGCPTQAYDKDPVTGIVKHLDDQCFGCRYCELKCPYGVPQYNERLGVVRKCDMCSSRLADGEAPACVQSCPNEAIKIRIVDQDPKERSDNNFFGSIAGAPDAKFTLPSTSYITKKNVPKEALPLDAHLDKPEHPHWPLVMMLTLTQAGLGAWTGATLSSSTIESSAWIHFIAFTLMLIGLGIAPLHLGRPLLAYRAFLGFRTSWLSREMLTFGPMPPLAISYLILAFHQNLQNLFGISIQAVGIAPLFAWGTIIISSAGVFCSAMIYIDTPRPWWSHPRTFAKFFLTAASFGTLFTTAALLIQQKNAGTWPLFALSFCFIKLLLEGSIFISKDIDCQRTAKLMKTSLFRFIRLRFSLGSIALLLLCTGHPWGVMTATLLWLLGEVSERYLFFTAVVAPRMPGENIA